mmetsp:Transcript_36275/g.53137  ORF Transcript_36275/g.53137 Transcript_36275/m.53137 type:complete len:85 (-) Transcript_36275:150-404(-)
MWQTRGGQKNRSCCSRPDKVLLEGKENRTASVPAGQNYAGEEEPWCPEEEVGGGKLYFSGKTTLFDQEEQASGHLRGEANSEGE